MDSNKFLPALKSTGIPVQSKAAAFEKDASFFQRKILGIISPTSQADVARSVRLAQEHDISLYPISGGKNCKMSRITSVVELVRDISKL